jgi:hypothetical protein
MTHQNQSEEFRFNEVLFEHRNKEYGAYVLRNESGRILTKSLFIGASLLAAISITPLVINAFKSVDKAPDGTIFELPPPINVETPEQTPPQSQPVQSQPAVRTYDSSVPTPSKMAPDDSKKEKAPDDAVAGLTNDFKADPAPQSSYVPTTPSIGTGPVITTAPPKISDPIPDDNHVAEGNELGEEAKFMGGIDAFRNKVINGFDGSGFDSDEVMKTTITFIVEKDGTISGIKADGKDATFNAEAIRTIKSIRGKWTPGKNKQKQAVRSYFKFPISMKFDN